MESTTSAKYTKALADLGLTKSQSLLYLTSLKHGLLSALELARLTKINRQQVYEDAEKLVAAGLYDITRKQRRKYIPADPKRLLQLTKEKLSKTEETLTTLTAILPELENLGTLNPNEIVTRHYEGVKGIKKAYEDELAEAQGIEILSLAGSLTDIYRFFPEVYWQRWNKQLVTQSSRSRMIVHTSKTAAQTAQLDRHYNRTTRHIETLPLKVNIDIYNDTILIVSFYDKLAVTMKSPIVADSYRMIFETLWALTKPYKS